MCYLRRVVQAVVLSSVLSLTGCVALSTMQGPDVLDPGEGTIGAGISALGTPDGVGVGWFDLYGRYGLAPRLDGGIKLTGIGPLAGVLHADLKYQLVDGSTMIALDGGASVSGTIFGGGGVSTAALYPMILVGSESFYGGAKVIYFTAGSVDVEGAGDSDFTFGGTLPGIVVGGSFGSSWKVRPELNLYFSDFESISALGGIGLQYQFGGSGE